jgi:hypothetical protein
MGKWTVERWAASTGIGFAVLLLVGGMISGSPKKYNASAADITSYLHKNHKEILIGGILFGIGYVLFLWFVASFAGLFREAGQRRLSTIMYGAGIATVTIAAIGDGTNIALARLVYFDDPKTVQGLYGVQSFFFGRLWWTTAAFALATVLAVRRSKAMPDWYAWLTLVAAVMFVLGGVALKTTGFFSPSGGMGFVAFLSFIVWIVTSSVLLVRRTATAAAPMAAPAMS